MRDNKQTLPVTPILRWAGSKRKLLPALADFWAPGHRRYVEPFAGSAALFFHVQPARALLGDINSALIDTYDVLRDCPDDLHAAVARLPRTESRYYAMRSKREDELSQFQRAVRFVYLNRLCFNGIFRTNQQGGFNVPYAHTRAGSIPPVEQFRRCAHLLAGAHLKHGDFGAVLSSTRSGDFVYMDPPYAAPSQRIFREYDKRAFTERDLERLKEHLVTLHTKNVTFVVSYADSPAARKLFSAWHIQQVTVRRNVAGFVAARRTAHEILVTNSVSPQ